MPQSTPTATPTRAVNEIDITEKAEDKAKAANLVLKAPDSRLPSLFRKVFSKNKLHPHQSGGSFTAKKLQFDYTAPPHQQDDKDAAEKEAPSLEETKGLTKSKWSPSSGIFKAWGFPRKIAQLKRCLRNRRPTWWYYRRPRSLQSIKDFSNQFGEVGTGNGSSLLQKMHPGEYLLLGLLIIIRFLLLNIAYTHISQTVRSQHRVYKVALLCLWPID